MDVYTLNDNLGHEDIIEKFAALIWTERYSAYGDVTIKMKDTPGNRDLLKEGTLLQIEDSDDIMMLETPSIEDGSITAIGPTLTGFLQNRMVRDTWANDSQFWSLTGTPGWICSEIVRQMCMAGGKIATGAVVTGGANEVIPNLQLGPIVDGGPAVNIPVKYTNVYEQVKAVCDVYGLGFFMRPGTITDNSYNLIFSVYAGRDLSSGQTVNQPVIFEPSLDSLAKTKELRSIAGYKNVAYVWASGIESATSLVGIAYADGAQSKTGFDRRSIMVDASDITQPDPPLTNAQILDLLNQRAKDTLANNNYVKIVDGEIVPQLTYSYGTDYVLGDIVELRSGSEIAQKARITEYIRSADTNGVRAYPTLSVLD